jgi:hypothetical protein
MAIGPINPNAPSPARIDLRDGAPPRPSESSRGSSGRIGGDDAGIQINVGDQLDFGRLSDIAGPGPADIADPGEALVAARSLAQNAQDQLGGQSLSIANRNPDRLAALVR